MSYKRDGVENPHKTFQGRFSMDFLPFEPLHNMSLHIYLYVELQVLIHGVDVIEDVVCNSGDDSHELRVVQFSLRTQNRTVARESSLRDKIRGRFTQTSLFQRVPMNVCCSGEGLT